MPNFDLTKSVYLYILLLNNGHYYTGITSDIQARLKQHQSGLAKYTYYLRPVKLIYCELYPDREIAAKRERFVKRKGAVNYMASKGLYMIP